LLQRFCVVLSTSCDIRRLLQGRVRGVISAVCKGRFLKAPLRFHFRFLNLLPSGVPIMHAHRSLYALAHGLALVVMLVLSPAARAQSVPTTTVSGNVYQANGAVAGGTLQISWPAFTTTGGQAVAAGRTSAKIGSDGKVTVALAPNIGAMPAGLFYTAVYHLSDGTTSTEYWVVPNTIQATIAQVRSTVLPAAQAVQAVNKAYVDQSIAQAVSSQITPSGGTLTGPLYLAGDPTQAAQAANKHYVDTATAQLLPIAGGTLSGPVTGPRIGAVLQADQFPGADFGAQLQACVNALDPAYGGTCDARNFPGQVAMAANLTLAVPNVTIYLPCSTIATAASILVPGGTRNVSLHGCASRGTSAASGAQGGTVLLYSGNSALLQVGDPSFLADTKGFRLDNAALNTTATPEASAQAVAFYRTQEISLASLYLLGNANQTAVTLDGTGNYTGGTFEDMQFTGFQAAVNGIGHTVDNAATTDWLNASTFLRMHIDCPTQNGSPVAGTTGINLQAGDGNTFTGGDVEGCATALHLGAHAVNNTLVGVRNENSSTQILADAGSSYNNWITGGTMYTGKLVDNGTRNSFLDTFHRSFNGVNGDWYGSQQDATVTNHFRLGIGTGNERGLLDRYQTDLGYRWTTGLSDGSTGIQYYQVLDELNQVYRLSLGQYDNTQGTTNNQSVLNAAGTGAVILNGSNNAGTGGVVFGSGGPSSSTVATVDRAGNANFLGTLQVGGVAQSTGTMTVRNNADAEVDYYLWPGVTSSQKGSFTYKDFNGSSQWYMVKDQANNWALNSAPGGLDSFKAYQSTNSGDTYVNAAKSTGHIRLNYETGAGAETDIYSGSSSSLAAAFLGPTAIKLPGLAAGTGKSCVQIDSSGYLSNTGGGCGLAATVATAGLAFSDGSVQTTSQQGALTGQANDATARSAAATANSAAAAAGSDAQTGITNAAAAQTSANSALNGQANDAAARTSAAAAEADAQTGITNAAAAQTSANSALNGQANDAAARTSVATAEADAQTGITNAAAAQTSANSALNGLANDAAARTSAAAAEADAQTGIAAASAAQSTADAALAANGVTSTGSGSSGTVAFPGAVASRTVFTANFNRALYVDGTYYAFTGQGITDALNACNSNAGGGVHVGFGTFAATTTIPISTKCALRGEGRFATVVQATAPMDALMSVNAAAGFGNRGGPVIDMTIDGNGYAQRDLDCSMCVQRRFVGLRLINALSAGLTLENAQNNIFEDMDYEYNGCTSKADGTAKAGTCDSTNGAAIRISWGSFNNTFIRGEIGVNSPRGVLFHANAAIDPAPAVMPGSISTDWNRFIKTNFEYVVNAGTGTIAQTSMIQFRTGHGNLCDGCNFATGKSDHAISVIKSNNEDQLMLPITHVNISSNVLTLTLTNPVPEIINVNDQVVITGLSTYTFLNNQKVVVTAAASDYSWVKAAFSHDDVDGADTGSAKDGAPAPAYNVIGGASYVNGNSNTTVLDLKNSRHFKWIGGNVVDSAGVFASLDDASPLTIDSTNDLVGVTTVFTNQGGGVASQAALMGAEFIGSAMFDLGATMSKQLAMQTGADFARSHIVETDAPTLTPNATTEIHTVVLTMNTVMAAPTNATQGDYLTYIFQQDSTGGRVVTWDPTYKIPTGVAVNTAPNSFSAVTFVYNGAWQYLTTPANIANLSSSAAMTVGCMAAANLSTASTTPIYVPFGGGCTLQSNTEADVKIPVAGPGRVSVTYARLTADPGIGNTVVFVLRADTGSGPFSTGATCTITGGGPGPWTCNTVASATLTAGTLLDWKITTTGTVSATPNVYINVKWQGL